MAEAILREKVEEQGRNIRRMAQECQTAINNSTSSMEDCPYIWDGIVCWPNSPPGLLSTQPCPAYIIGFNPSSLASKKCTAEGEWFVSPLTNNTWTNYTQCYNESTTSIVIRFPHSGNISLYAEYVPLMKTVSHIGYAVSLATLIVAFCIFSTFKRLRCPRNKLHMHLFASFMLRAFCTLLKNTLFVKGIGLPSDFIMKDGERFFNHESKTSWQCKSIISLWQYCIMANYSWILMEGLYLHHLIFFSVFSDTSSIAFFVILGWGLPILFVVPWVLVRIFLEDTLCWTTNDNHLYFQLIKAPTAASILINLILFFNIVRVLLSKLNASISEETRRFRYRRWAKSTLVLMPLFGVHYAVYVTMSYIGVEGRVELVWLFIDQLFTSFQGCFVAILYCLMNGEVRAEVARKWRRLPSLRRQYDRRASAPLSTLSQQPGKRSYLGAVFNRRRGPQRAKQNGCKRSSNADTCMSSLVSSGITDMNTTSFVTHNPHARRSVIPIENMDCTTTPGPENHLLT